MSEKQSDLVAGSDQEEEVTDVVCVESHLNDGEMMEVEVGHHNILLIRSDGVYSAISNQCTHYGAPLSKGVLSGHRVRCPWHGSCFNVKTGDLEEYPGIDCLPCHKVKVDNSKVYVSVKKKIQGQPKRIKWMGVRDQGVFHTVMLLGGGAASLICAETLRQENYGGRIIMVSRDDLLPYDKTRLSKVMNAESDSLLMRSMDFFHKYDIEVWLKKEALSIDTNKKTVTFDDGLIQCYDQILIATGCRAKSLDCPGADLENVLMLETPEDARSIHYACMGCRTVFVGTSFVGMEVAAYMIDKARSITIIGSTELPYQKTLGPEIGKVTMMMLEENGVTFHMNDAIAEVQGENRRVKAVKLKSGTTIETDVLIVGIGVVPNSEFLKGSPIRMDSKNYVIVDNYMRTNITDVYCAGDLTAFPLKMARGQRVSIGHWQIAQTHGYGEGYTEMVLKGKFENMKFLALYLKHDEVVAAAGLNVEPAVSVVAERLAEGRVITKAEAMSDDLSWLKLQPL
ncbi:apoptosis-inducing factor 3 isoform X2 [Myxocyprinus asiaticus]|uniref:apoptosis-inducing factor 3 isoform X2 n=1 Tax=Myxocyprinus asiaticus TaxID=70543 RepID=UPI0022233908|nr:apoptosis-inducing factor 3 isoform X2 [Myxocyprinus asiaticus]